MVTESCGSDVMSFAPCMFSGGVVAAVVRETENRREEGASTAG